MMDPRQRLEWLVEDYDDGIRYENELANFVAASREVLEAWTAESDFLHQGAEVERCTVPVPHPPHTWSISLAPDKSIRRCEGAATNER